jgi:glycosyltransferase involved in cell wall biosynthesis
MPKFSVIMASFLGTYPNSAKDRDKKIIRAVNSVLDQTYNDLELIVVADGCQKTIDLLKEYEDPRIRVFLIPKARMWSGEPRNTGIDNARGEFIVYLDVDDVWGENHLKSLANALNEYDWVWFDDNRYIPKTDQWYQNSCDVTKIGRCGTSNICHKRELNVHWDHPGYAHDYYFIEQLRNYKNFGKVNAGEYFVCHLPGAGGWDL